jgi:hypothetical protein
MKLASFEAGMLPDSRDVTLNHGVKILNKIIHKL